MTQGLSLCALLINDILDSIKMPERHLFMSFRHTFYNSISRTGYIAVLPVEVSFPLPSVLDNILPYASY